MWALGLYVEIRKDEWCWKKRLTTRCIGDNMQQCNTHKRMALSYAIFWPNIVLLLTRVCYNEEEKNGQ